MLRKAASARRGEFIAIGLFGTFGLAKLTPN
jgi:hypothetical protein